jgi:hypothetical protein
LRDAVQWMEARHFQFYTSVYFGWLAEACAVEGEVENARHYAAYVLRRARKGERLGEAATCRAMARMSGAESDFAASERWLKRAETSASIRGSPREAALNQAARGQILARQGRAVEGSRLMTQAASALRALGMDWHAEQAVRES